MEQQKLLWTILSVGILILILLGAGMFFFLPADSTGIAQNGKTTEWSKAASPAPEQKGITATITLITYRRSKAYNEEDTFQ